MTGKKEIAFSKSKSTGLYRNPKYARRYNTVNSAVTCSRYARSLTFLAFVI